ADSVTSVAISPDREVIVIGHRDRTVRLWSRADGALLTTLTGHTAEVHSAAISPNGWLLATASADETVRIWRLPDGKPLQILQGRYQGVDFQADGRQLITRHDPQTKQTWPLSDQICHLFVGQTDEDDLYWIVEALRTGTLTPTDRQWLEFIRALTRWQQQVER
ncbi:hypothetical protein GF339_10135, partial [candidate division KSB3 bacterium]|nr:hypothetical protein [candidate division KSB3 bacterium]MBD3324933.1 hypothetical protein [candidate division KSB3 bacterium]